MSDLDSAKSGTVSLSLAIALPDGRWGVMTGELSYVDGHIHTVKVGGIETKSSGEAVGITVTVHVLVPSELTPPWRGDIARHEYVNGRLMKVETIHRGVELIMFELPREYQQGNPG